MDFFSFLNKIQKEVLVLSKFLFYQDLIQIILINHDPKESVSFKRGDRIAQLVIQQVERAEFIEVESLPGSGRGTGGFGSTGGKS